MTWIVYGAVTKKELKQKLQETPERISFEDPSIFAPKFLRAEEIPAGFKCVCTNHPKRSWFAQVERLAASWRVT